MWTPKRTILHGKSSRVSFQESQAEMGLCSCPFSLVREERTRVRRKSWSPRNKSMAPPSPPPCRTHEQLPEDRSHRVRVLSPKSNEHQGSWEPKAPPTASMASFTMRQEVNQAGKNEHHTLPSRLKSLQVDLKEAENRPVLPEQSRAETGQGGERMGPGLHRRDSAPCLTHGGW